VHADVMSQDEARAIGAMALFGEKYGDRVRVVSVGEWARELCGGTHLRHTGELGVVTLLHESSVGAGVRRVEALVGADAHRFLAREHLIVAGLSEALKARPEELPERVDGLLTRLRDAERALERQRAASLLEAAPALAAAARAVGSGRVVTEALPEGTDADGLRRLALDVRARLGTAPAVVALGAVRDGRPVVVVATNEEARAAGLGAGDLVRTAATLLGGGGGGKADVAQGGGSDPAALPTALAAVGAEVDRVLGG
jgi:alanyl-tRNA synthetase